MTARKLATNPRCHAHRKNGDQCKRLAINGGSVCPTHGGSAPNTRRKARERILAAADPAVTTVVEIMFNKSNPAAVRLAAAKDLLDRAELSGTSRVALDVDIEVNHVEFSEMVEAAKERLRVERANRLAIEDAEIVEEDEVVETISISPPPSARLRVAGAS